MIKDRDAIVILEPLVYCAFVGDAAEVEHITIGQHLVVLGVMIGVDRDVRAPTLSSCVLE